MKNILHIFGLVMLLLCMVLGSCRKEEFEFEGTPPGQTLKANSTVANLLQRIALKDGSPDNLIDGASCFSLKLPVTVEVDGLEVIIDQTEDYATLEELLDNAVDGFAEIQFPVTLINPDFSETTIATSEEFNTKRAECPMGDAQDLDIECVDIQYPFNVSLFNTVTELTTTTTIGHDEALYGFIAALNEDDVVEIQFPVVLLLSDGTENEIDDLVALETTVENVKDDCDEGDDSIVNEERCTDCEQTEEENCGSCDQEFLDTWARCTQWEAHLFVVDWNNIKEDYEDFSLNFQHDGGILANSATETYFGTWSTGVDGDKTILTIEILGLEDFNAAWILYEIKEKKDDVVDVQLYNGFDTLHIQSTCTEGNPGDNDGKDPAATLQSGSWEVGSYLNDEVDETDDFVGYTINFESGSSVIADNGAAINGVWTGGTGNTRLLLNFGAAPFDQFNRNWRFVSVTDTTVELQFIETESVMETLVFEKL